MHHYPPTLLTAALVSISLHATEIAGVAQWKSQEPPAGKQSGMPFLTSGADGSVYLSWIDTAGEQEHALRFARWSGSGWEQPGTIAQGKNWFINWADFPSLQVLPDGSMLAHWLTRPGGGDPYGYGIRVARRGPRAGGRW